MLVELVAVEAGGAREPHAGQLDRDEVVRLGRDEQQVAPVVEREVHARVVERRTRPETRTKKPPMYKVILLNDDYTPMEFVVEILKVVFHKQHAEATRIMLHVHQNGMGVAGVFPYEIAETKVRTVEELARQSEFPLKCVMEKA